MVIWAEADQESSVHRSKFQFISAVFVQYGDTFIAIGVVLSYENEDVKEISEISLVSRVELSNC